MSAMESLDSLIGRFDASPWEVTLSSRHEAWRIAMALDEREIMNDLLKRDETFALSSYEDVAQLLEVFSEGCAAMGARAWVALAPAPLALDVSAPVPFESLNRARSAIRAQDSDIA